MLPKLGILAGRGQLPIMIIDACKTSGRPFFVIAFPGQTPPETVVNVPHVWVRMGAGAEILCHLKTEGVKDLVLAGGIRKPNLLQLRPDWWGIKFIIKARNYRAGDDSLLQALIRTLEREEGFRVISPNSLVSELLAKPGFLSTTNTDISSHLPDIRLGIQAALDLGRQDKGQAAVAKNAEIVGVEDEEGTDALLRRLATERSLDEMTTRTGVLVKVAKPEQETRVDLPTIGPDTIAMVNAAGLAGVVVEASRSLVIDSLAVQQEADKVGVFVCAVKLADVLGQPLMKDAPLASPEPHVFMVAGEPSGDKLGAALIKDLKRKVPSIRVSGVGGSSMKNEGMISLFPMEELSVMGVAEVLPRLGSILKRIRQTADAIIAEKPNAVVTIDSPDFCFRVAKRLKGKGIPLIHYVAPSVWAWRPGRARKIARFLDHLLVLLPFEPPYFETVGLPCTFVGHPIVETDDLGNGHKFRQAHNIDKNAQVICVLPGSRKGEVNRLLPTFLDAIEQLPTQDVPQRHFIFPTVNNTDALVRTAVQRINAPLTIVSEQENKHDALAACDVAIAASGTVALELAQARVPAIIAYRFNPVTAFIARRLIKVPYASLVNILEDREVTPELIQEDCTAENISQELESLLIHPEKRAEQVSGCMSALKKLVAGRENGESAATAAILKIMKH